MESYQRVPKPKSDSFFLITFFHQRIQKRTPFVNLYENIISANGFRCKIVNVNQACYLF